MEHSIIYTAPPGTGEAVRGKTLPQLLYEACDRFQNPRALNQPMGDGTWEPLALTVFREQAEETALGLYALGLDRGDHVAFYMESDVYFCVADMGCLLAGIIDVPIYLSSGPEAVTYIIKHAECSALVVSNLEFLAEITDLLVETPNITRVIVAESDDEAAQIRLPDGVELITLEDVRARGRARLEQEPNAIDHLREQIDPGDLATIIYTSGTTGKPKGVMLSHENISFNAMTAFSGLRGYRPGPSGEKAISFLPMTHIFARALHYGFVAYGTSVYFSTPDDLGEALIQVKPTSFATVPRLLEKVYARIQEKTSSMTGVKQKLGAWALELAQDYELGESRSFQLLLADLLVFRKWRKALGSSVRFIISGGAALDPEIANVFAAAGVPVLQGYGLTETSPVITYNRPDDNRAGTVGVPLPDVEVRIAEDGEILTRGPHVMQGYFKQPEQTAEVIDADGWFHTGDIGTFTEEGHLKITDRKKSLFKLSTGKYVMPQPLETRLAKEALVEHAVVVGEGKKFCTALIFLDQEALRAFARREGLGAGLQVEELVDEPAVMAAYQQLVDKANQGMDHWSTIKRFALIPDHLSIENGLLTPTLKVRRAKVREAFKQQIEALYDEHMRNEAEGVTVK